MAPGSNDTFYSSSKTRDKEQNMPYTSSRVGGNSKNVQYTSSQKNNNKSNFIQGNASKPKGSRAPNYNRPKGSRAPNLIYSSRREGNPETGYSSKNQGMDDDF